MTQADFQPRDAYALGRLRKLGLTRESLLSAVLFGYREALNIVSPNDPTILQAWVRYAKSTGRLRTLLHAQGWLVVREQGYELTVSPDGRNAIVVCSADAYTGIDEPGKRPSARNEKGAMTEAAVLANTGRGTVEMRFDSPTAVQGWTRQTWMLLHYLDLRKNQIRMELSLPTGFTRSDPKDRRRARGYIDIWGERLILPPIPFVLPAASPIAVDEQALTDEYKAEEVEWKDQQD